MLSEVWSETVWFHDATVCLHLLKNISIFPCWVSRESMTTGSISVFPRGLKQMEV